MEKKGREKAINRIKNMDYFNQKSNRLRFRKLTEEDIPNWLEFFIDNPNLGYLGMDLKKTNEELAEGWIKAQFDRYKNQGLGHLAVELEATKTFIGMGGILPRELNGQPEFEIAYSLKPKYWGKGYATEIAQTMKNYGFQNIETNRFISIIHIENTASAKVAQKNEMNVLFETEFFGMPVEVYGINKENE